MTDRRFFDSLESMRGIAALTVVLLHMPPLLSERYIPAFVDNGFLMVPFFFVLSGFVIHRNYFDVIEDRWTFLRFIFLRIGRLYPVHLVFLLVWLAAEFVRYGASHLYGLHAPGTVPFRENSPLAFVENLFLVQALGFTNDGGTFNGPSWSISVEFYTYTIFAFSVLTARPFFAPIAAAVIALGTMIITFHCAGTFDNWVSCLVGFYLGALISVTMDRKWRCPLGAVIPVITFFAVLSIKPQPLAGLLVYPASAFLIFSLLHDHGVVSSVLALAPLRWLGKMSYSLYLSHMIVAWGGGILLALLLRADLSGSAAQRFAYLNGAIAFSSYVGILAVIFLVTAVVYYFIEEPCRRWSRAKARVLFSNSSRGSNARASFEKNIVRNSSG